MYSAKSRALVGLQRFRSFILQFDPDFVELQLAWLNVAMGLYIFTQSLFGYREDPPFFNAIISIAPVIFWELLFVGTASYIFWARKKQDKDTRTDALSLSMMVWVFLLCFLWSSFFWASGKISIVHFISPVIVFSNIATCIRLCAERRKISYATIIEQRISAKGYGEEIECQPGNSSFRPLA